MHILCTTALDNSPAQFSKGAIHILYDKKMPVYQHPIPHVTLYNTSDTTPRKLCNTRQSPHPRSQPATKNERIKHSE